MSAAASIALAGKIFPEFFAQSEFALALLEDRGIIKSMISFSELPHDVESCHALLQTQAATIEELATEMEKMRKLLSHFINGHRSEKRILPAENQALLPFELSLIHISMAEHGGHADW